MNILDAVVCQFLDQHSIRCCGHNFLKYKKIQKKHWTLIAMLTDGTCIECTSLHPCRVTFALHSLSHLQSSNMSFRFATTFWKKVWGFNNTIVFRKVLQHFLQKCLFTCHKILVSWKWTKHKLKNQEEYYYNYSMHFIMYMYLYLSRRVLCEL